MRLPLISAVIGVVMVGFMVVIALHELGHLIAARALGLPARVSLTTRLYFITARTEVPSLWAVPRRKRHLVYLAGMATDLLVACLAVIVASLWVPARPWMGMVMVLTGFNMIIQLQLYMRTDLYLVAAELARSKNLFDDSAGYLRHRLGRMRDRLARRPARTLPDPLIALPARSRKVVRRYAVVMAVGTVLSLAFYLLVLLPAMVDLAVTSIETIHAGIADTHEHHPGHDLHVVDGVLTLTLQFSLLTLFVRTWWRQRRTRLAATPAAHPTHHNQ